MIWDVEWEQTNVSLLVCFDHIKENSTEQNYLHWQGSWAVVDGTILDNEKILKTDQ